MGFLPRLSVIIPSFNQRAFCERAVQSVLDQPEDPVGTEIVVVDGRSRDGTYDHLASIFHEARSSGRLLLLQTERKQPDRAALITEGVAKAGGSVLAFLDSRDWWKPGRLAELEPLLKRHDLIVASDHPPPPGVDWFRNFLAENPATPSSGVIRRTLLEEVGGYGQRSVGLREDEYALWIRCLELLSRTGRKDRFTLIPNRFVVNEEMLLPGVTLPEGIAPKLRSLRDGAALLSVARSLPRRYWPTLARRLVETGKGFLKRKP